MTQQSSKMLLLGILILQVLTVGGVEVKVGDGGVSVKVGGKFLMPEVAVDVKIPKFLDDLNLDKMSQIDLGLIDFLKNVTDKEYLDNGEAGCITVLRKLAFKSVPAFNTCLRDFQLTVGKLRKRAKEILPCMVRCVGTQMNIFKEDGTFNFAYAPELLQEAIPPRMHALVGKVMQSCFQHVAGINPNDPTCDSYRPLMKCLIDSAFEVADEALDLCPDIPDVFKKAAKRIAKSKRTQRRIAKIIDPDLES